MLILPAAMGAGNFDPIITYIGSASNTSNLTTYTFPSIDVGAAAADLFVIVAAGGGDNAYTISSANIHGVVATVNQTRSAATGGGTTNEGSGIFSALVPAGGSGSIVITWSGVFDNCTICVWRVTGLDSTTPLGSNGNSGNIQSRNIALIVQGGGILVASGCNGDASAVTITGETTERHNAAIEGIQTVCLVDFLPVANDAAKVITMNATGEICGVSWR